MSKRFEIFFCQLLLSQAVYQQLVLLKITWKTIESGKTLKETTPTGPSYETCRSPVLLRWEVKSSPHSSQFHPIAIRAFWFEIQELKSSRLMGIFCSNNSILNAKDFSIKILIGYTLHRDFPVEYLFKKRKSQYSNHS